MTDLTLAVVGFTIALIGAALFLRHGLAQFFRLWMLRMLLENQDNQSGHQLR